MKRYVLALTFVVAAAPAYAQTAAAADPHAGHAMEMQAPAAAQAPAPGPRNPNLPPTGDAPGDNKNAVALDQLKSSPRKSEWVDIKGSNGTPIKSFVVYPARRDKAPVVIVIQEIFGLSDWIRGVTDQLAKEGFIAIAPDFMSGMGPNKGGSAELGEQGATREIGKLTDDDKVRILNDVRTYALAIPSANGKLGTVGFCWGGGTSFLYAIKQPALNAAVSYYGPMPGDPAAFATVEGAGARPLWRQRQSREREHRDDEERHGAGQGPVRAAHLRGRGPRVPASAERQRERSRQHEGGRGGLAPDHRVPEAAHQVRRGTPGVRLTGPGLLDPARRIE